MAPGDPALLRTTLVWALLDVVLLAVLVHAEDLPIGRADPSCHGGCGGFAIRRCRPHALAGLPRRAPPPGAQRPGRRCVREVLP